MVIRKIMEEYNFPHMIAEHLGSKNAGLFLDLAAYSIITEGNAAQHYPTYAYNHPLFTEKMLEKAKGYGFRQVGFVLDRGYFSKENIRFMDKNGYEFIIMMKGMKSLVCDLVLSAKLIKWKPRYLTVRFGYRQSRLADILRITLWLLTLSGIVRR